MLRDLINSFAENLIPFFTTQLMFSIILFGVIYIITRILKNKSRLIILGLWAFIFIRLILPTDFSLSFSGRMLIERFMNLYQSDTIFENNKPVPQFPIGTLSETDPENSDPAGTDNPIAAILLLMWLIGFLTMLTIYRMQVKKYRRLVKNSTHCENLQIRGLLEKWQREFKIRRQIQIVTGESPKPPFTVGLFKPVIYLPSCFCTKNDLNTIESIIAHEMVHIKNWDDLWITLQNFIQIIYFFNPVIWFAGYQLSQIREQFCDAVVISRKQISPKNYGNGLLNVVQMRLHFANPILQVLPTFSNKKERLVERIKNIKQVRLFTRWHFVFSILILILLGAILLPMGNRSFSENPVQLQTPLPEGFIVLEFGKEWNANEQKYNPHNGIDLYNYGKQSTILASADGKVISTGQDEIFQDFKEVTLQHEDGLQTRYLHVDSVYVAVGQNIKQGQKIAHIPWVLHFEVRQDGTPQDPENYLTLPKNLTRKVIKD